MSSVTLDPNGVECRVTYPEKGRNGKLEIVKNGHTVASQEYGCINSWRREHCTVESEQFSAYFDYATCQEMVGAARYSGKNLTLIPDAKNGMSIIDLGSIPNFEINPNQIECHEPEVVGDFAMFKATAGGEVISARAQCLDFSCGQPMGAYDRYAECLSAVGVAKATGQNVRVNPLTSSLWVDKRKTETVTSADNVSCQFGDLLTGKEISTSSVKVGDNILVAETGYSVGVSNPVDLYAQCVEQKGLATLLGRNIVVDPSSESSLDQIILEPFDSLREYGYSLMTDPSTLTCTSESIGGFLWGMIGGGLKLFEIKVDGHIVYATDMEPAKLDRALQECNGIKNQAESFGRKLYINFGRLAQVEMNRLLTIGNPEFPDHKILTIPAEK